MFFFLLLIWSIAYSSEAYKISDIIVSDKLVKSKKDSHEVIEVINKRELEQSTSIEDALAKVSGAYIVNTGAQSSLTFRSLGQEHVLILIDGIPVSDYSGVQNSFDLSSLSLANIERIEVVKGANSVMYGSSSIGAVVNIVSTKYTKPFLLYENGFRERAELSSGKVFKRTAWNISGYYEKDDSLSRKEGAEKDTTRRRGVNLNLSHELSSAQVDFFARINNHFDEDDSFSGDASSLYSKTDSIATRLSIESDHFNFAHSFSKHDRQSLTFFPQVDYFKSETQLFSLDYFLQKKWILGTQYEYRMSESQQAQETVKSLYTIRRFTLFDLDLSLGGRFEDYKSFGGIALYSFSLMKKLNSQNQVRFLAKKGFSAPSFFQLYSSFGNELLEAEEAYSYELSYLYSGKIRFESSLFFSEIENLIEFESSRYINKNDLRSKGIDFELAYEKSSYELKTSASYIDYNSSELIRRPRFRGKLELQTKFEKEFYLGAHYLYTGKRRDVSQTLPAFDLFNFSLTKKNKTTDYYLKLNNIFNEKYENTEDFQTLGFNYTIGGKYYF